jgi:magnesium chelatase subunit I
MDDYIFEEVKIKKTSSPDFILNNKEIDIWSEGYIEFHSKSIIEYIRDVLLEFEKKDIDP